MKSTALKTDSKQARDLLKRFKAFLRGTQFSLEHPAFGKAVEFLRQLPVDATPYEIKDLREVVCRAFSISDEELTHAIAREDVKVLENVEEKSIFGDYDVLQAEKDLVAILPTEGFINDYLACVKNTEPPLAYHVFAALTACGAMIGGRVFIDMGVYQLFPPLGVLILGPSGVIKTKACDFAVGLVQATESVTIYSEIQTPQSLAVEMSQMAQGIIYAPELTATLLTKDKFMDGMLTFLTRVLDHPRPVLPKNTVSGGKIIITEPTASLLACSTIEWLVERTPPGTFDGGFMARNILVIQEDSPRIVPRPRIDKDLKQKLLMTLSSLQQYSGQVIFTPEAEEYYDHWYNEKKPQWKNPEVALMSTIYRRRTDNVQRIATILHLAHCGTCTVCLDCFKRASDLLEWTDRFTIPALKRVFKTGAGKDQEIVLAAIKHSGGVVEHSALVRKLQYRMNARQLRPVLDSLIAAQQIEERQQGVQHAYFLL